MGLLSRNDPAGRAGRDFLREVENVARQYGLKRAMGEVDVWGDLAATRANLEFLMKQMTESEWVAVRKQLPAVAAKFGGDSVDKQPVIDIAEDVLEWWPNGYPPDEFYPSQPLPRS